MEQHNNAPVAKNKTVVVVKNQKSVGLAILLTFLFGPLGMLYSTVSGAIIMIIVSVIVGFVTLGFGVLFTWPVCIIWGALAASKTNNKVIEVNNK